MVHWRKYVVIMKITLFYEAYFHFFQNDDIPFSVYLFYVWARTMINWDQGMDKSLQ